MPYTGIPYTGRDGVKVTVSRFGEWLFYTLAMGILPSGIKLLTACIYKHPLSFYDYLVEVFFLTIVLLVDTIRNFNAVSNRLGKLAIFLLVVTSAVYGTILMKEIVFGDEFFTIVSDTVIKMVTIILLSSSLLLDLWSIRST